VGDLKRAERRNHSGKRFAKGGRGSNSKISLAGDALKEISFNYIFDRGSPYETDQGSVLQEGKIAYFRDCFGGRRKREYP